MHREHDRSAIREQRTLNGEIIIFLLNRHRAVLGIIGCQLTSISPDAGCFMMHPSIFCRKGKAIWDPLPTHATPQRLFCGPMTFSVDIPRVWS